MSERWLGIVVSSDKIIIVDAEIEGPGDPMVIQMDGTWSLQAGDRPSAYRVLHQRVADYARQNKIACAAVKAIAVSLRGTKKVHLEAAELRGVVLAALASTTKVISDTKANISRNFGDRNVDEYLKDNDFWSKQIKAGNLRNGSREAAMVILAARP